MNRRDFIIWTARAGLAAALPLSGLYGCAQSSKDSARIAFRPLPYDGDALAPHLSQETMHIHHGQHYRTYVAKTRQFIAGTRLADMSLAKIVTETSGRAKYRHIFNNAAQAYNHTLFFNSLSPSGGGKPEGDLLRRVKRSFGSVKNFKHEFTNTARAQFGSGWVWLVKDGKGVAIVSTSNADTPIAAGKVPLLTLDLWEHAYYLDYRNRRNDYIDVFLTKLINWPFAASRLNHS